MPNILFSSLVSSTANCGPLSDVMLSSNPCNFYILSLNNLASSFADISSVIATKCVILDNLSQTTRIAFFPATNGNFVMKSTIRYVYGFSGTSLNFNFQLLPLFYSSSSDTYHTSLHISLHFLSLLATNNF